MTERFSRQSFLGINSQIEIETTTIGIVGAGGSGSHMIQQLLHVGFKNLIILDDDIVEETNTHRLVGINYPIDVTNKLHKIQVAERQAQNIQGQVTIETHKAIWQERTEHLKRCKVVVGCVDSYDQRDQLERFCRRYNIIYIDIGMIVKICEDEAPQVSGQVILSLPAKPCMWCLGFINEKKVTEERSRYGDAGPQPQVIWINGVLASLAVGIVVDLVTNWRRKEHETFYLTFDGNTGDVKTHDRLKYLKISSCVHHKASGETEFTDL